MATRTGQRLSIFPLGGALLFPRSLLPLHIFEPRYRAMVSDALARDRRIAMIQPRDGGEPPKLFDIGCVGHIREVKSHDDGRFDIILEGVSRFRVVRELDVTTPFRQVEGDITGFADAEEPEPLPSIVRRSQPQPATVSKGRPDWRQRECISSASLSVRSPIG